MTKREDRDTYLRESTVMDRVVDTSGKIAHFLEGLRNTASDERTQLHLDKLICLQNRLTEAIAEYREKAPWQVTNTYVQYADPGSGKVDDMIEDMIEQHWQCTSINDATNTALALNQELVRELEPVSINEGVEEVREAFDNLQLLIENTCRKIAINRSTATDI